MTDREEFISAINSKEFCYTRARNPSHPTGQWQSTNDLIVFVYGRAPEGHIHSLAALPYAEATQILDDHKKVFPLSPTEGIS